MLNNEDKRDEKKEVKKLSPIEAKIKELGKAIAAYPPNSQMGSTDKAVKAEKESMLKFLKTLKKEK